MYMLDTNAVIMGIRHPDWPIFQKIKAHIGKDLCISKHFGDIFGDLELKRMRISDRDTMIAAHARSLGYTLVTNNTREFSRVEGLKIEDWK
jgi:tRNA(fMet)-specific endonuclease VapC